jgi:methylenetetrahydrofolate--tRNA-(uracil-5-)-methyltransferase
VPVRLLEMRPEKMTEAHATGDVAELVCSNSLKSDEPENAHGLLKAEIRVLGSVLLECADRTRVPGGKALVVDRRRFSAEVQVELSRAGVHVERGEVTSIPASSRQPQAASQEPSDPAFGDGAWSVMHGAVCVIATGPLTSEAMAESLQALLGANRLFFYDAIAPIVDAESLDRSRVFEGSRYGAGSDYLNCPMTEEEYDRFVAALVEAELHPLHESEESAVGGQWTVRDGDTSTERREERVADVSSAPAGAGQPPFSPFFEGCLPVEEIARRGRLALAFGPMKPVGLVDPRAEPERRGEPQITQMKGSGGHQEHETGRPFAVVQLRRENAEGTMYNLVGFQTRLRQREQERVFRLIPGLEKASFLRFGSIHRNTYIDSPRLLLPTLQTRASPDMLVAGQLTGVEGYVESIGAGLVAGINAARLAKGDEPLELPREMMLGSLLGYIAHSGKQGTVPGRDAIPKSEFPMTNEGPGARSRTHAGRFQPMNANFGLLPPLEKRLRGRDKRRVLAERALAAARDFALTLADNRG